MTLDSDSIHLWCTFYDTIHDEGLLRKYEELLSESERQWRSRFALADDRLRFLVTRALVRVMLSRYVPDVAPGEWIFTPNVHGRPEIANDHPKARRIVFNLSHTRGLVVLGVTRSRALGVDTEHVGRVAPLAIADRFLAPSEIASLRTLPAEHRHRRFFEYWTLKESYLKARSMGLAIPLDTVSFDFSGARGVAMRLEGEPPASAASWWLCQFSVRRDHVVALCAERNRRRVPRLLMKETVPLLADYDLTEGVETLITSY